MENTLTLGQVIDNLKIGQVALKVRGLQGSAGEYKGRDTLWTCGMYINEETLRYESIESGDICILSYSPKKQDEEWIIIDRSKYNSLMKNILKNFK